VFPRLFARVNKAGMPVYAQLLGCTLSVALIALNLSGGMIQIYSFIILLATVAVLVLYLAGTVTMLALLKRGQAKGAVLAGAAVIGTVYAIWTFYGAGAEATGWGAALLATGIPVYFIMRSRGGSSRPAAASPAVPPELSA
jgi:APA family basic amino acid/polyamine antiporter